MSACRYNSKKNGLFFPTASIVNGVSLSNIEPHINQQVNLMVVRKMNRDKKKWKQYEDRVNFSCDKQFCSFCLKNYYDISLDQAQNNINWVCPYC